MKYPGFEFPPASGTLQNVRYFKNFNYKKKDVKLRSSDVVGTNT